jgi:hypothetical protein
LANFDFSSKPCVRLYLCSLMRTSNSAQAILPYSRQN